MAITVVNAIQVGDGLVSRPVTLSDGTIYIGSGNKIYKKAIGDANYSVYYEALAGGNNLSGEVFDVVIPFVHNDILYSIEYGLNRSDTNAYVKVNHESTAETLNDSLGDVIGSIPLVKQVFWVGVLQSRVIVLCENRVSVSGVAYNASRLYKSGGLVRQSGGFDQVPIKEGANTNGVNSEVVYGTYYDEANTLLKYGVTDSGAGNVQYVSYDGGATLTDIGNPQGQYTFGHHEFNGERYYFSYEPSTTTLKLRRVSDFQIVATLNQSGFDYNVGTLRSGLMASVVEGIDFVFMLYYATGASGQNASILVQYDKTTFDLDANVINRPIAYFAPNDYITGYGDTDIYYELESGTSEPPPPPEPEPESGFFSIPKMQSLSFSRMIDKNDNSDVFFPDLSSHSQQKQQYPTFGYGFCYYQQFRQSDNIKIQIQSAVSTIKLELLDVDENVVNIYTLEKKTQYQDNNLFFPVSIEDNGGGTSRVYFQGKDEIPVDLIAGESTIDILNADEPSYDGNYLVQSIEVDTVETKEYLTIDLEYTSAQARVLAEAGVSATVVPFDIYETTVDFSTVNEGEYYFKAYLDSFEAETVHYSEPIKIRESFKNSLKIEYSNFDNTFDLDYSTGFSNIIRPECIFFKRVPASSNTTIRNTDNSVEILRAKPQRKFEIQFIMLPPYLMEKLSVALVHDVVTINGVQFVCEEGLGEPEYIDRFGLATATAIVEQVNWFNNYNSDDLGGLEDDENLIIQNDGFIKR